MGVTSLFFCFALLFFIFCLHLGIGAVVPAWDGPRVFTFDLFPGDLSLFFFFFFSLSFIDVFAAGVCGRFHLSQVHCLSALVVNASMIFLYLVGLHIVTCTHVIICS